MDGDQKAERINYLWSRIREHVRGQKVVGFIQNKVVTKLDKNALGDID
jgi:hypothetical protein